MKTVLLATLVAGFLSAGFLHAQADTLYADNITVTGTIQQAPPTTGAAPVVYDLSKIADIFTFLGLPDDPKKQRWYWDSTLAAYVIAPKGIHDGGNGTPTVVFYEFGSGTEGVDYVEIKKHGKHLWGGNDTALNSNLPSTSYQNDVFGGGNETDTSNFIAYGKVSGTDTIVTGKIKDKFTY